MGTPPPWTAGPSQCQDLAWALQQEWLLTNGVGGYACSTLIGANTRRHHGLLVAATRPPGGRAVLLAKLEDTVVTPGARYELSTNRYPGVIHPEGYRYLEHFTLDPWPTFTYRVGGVVVEKQICLVPDEHTTVVTYRLREAAGAVELLVRPLVACRDVRWVSQENTTFRTRVEQGPGVVILHPYEGLPPLVLHHEAELFEATGYWYKSFEYAEEAQAGTVPREDLYSPGQFVFLLRPQEAARVIATTERTLPSRGDALAARAAARRAAIAQRAQARHAGPVTTRWFYAADQFVVRAADGARHLIAGYPQRPAGGREALIALPGLTLATGQPDAARELLQTMAGHCRDGLLPVRFTEDDGSPEYDSADTALWLFWAVDRYGRATGDWRFIGRRLLDVLMDIVDYYVQGTQFHIAMDQDGLITTEGEALPLTWMDAHVEGHPVTLREGKPVELNALWYNALMTMADLGDRFRLRLRRQYARLARLVKLNFLRSFWNPAQSCCYDVIGRRPDPAIRPNQLVAVGLPYPLLARPQARAVLDVARRELLTPVGVRTLAPAHPDYHPELPHQGSAWPWLLGAYWSGCLAAYGRSPATLQALRQDLEWLLARQARGVWGTLPERFTGDEPHQPRGASSSAWAVGECLRVMVETGIISEI